MAKKVQAFKVNEDCLKKNKIPAYNDLMDGSTSISPIKIRNMSSYFYHVAEDVNGDVYLIHDDVVLMQKLNDRNIGVSEVSYMLDEFGKKQIEKSKEKTLQQEEVEVELNEPSDEVNVVEEEQIEQQIDQGEEDGKS